MVGHGPVAHPVTASAVVALGAPQGVELLHQPARLRVGPRVVHPEGRGPGVVAQAEAQGLVLGVSREVGLQRLEQGVERHPLGRHPLGRHPLGRHPLGRHPLGRHPLGRIVGEDHPLDGGERVGHVRQADDGHPRGVAPGAPVDDVPARFQGAFEQRRQDGAGLIALVGPPQGVVHGHGLLGHPAGLGQKGLPELFEGGEPPGVAGGDADVLIQPRVPMAAVKQRELEHRRQVHQQRSAVAEVPAAGAGLHAAHHPVVPGVLQRVALCPQGGDGGPVVVQRRRGAGAQVGQTEPLQVLPGAHVGVEARVQIRIPELHELGGPQHHVGQLVHRVGALAIHAPDGDGLVGARATEELLTGLGHRGDVVADLEPQTAGELHRLVERQRPRRAIPAIQVDEERVEPAEAQPHVGVFQVAGGPADPDRGEPLAEGPRRLRGHPLVDLGQRLELGPSLRVRLAGRLLGGRRSQPPGVGDDPLEPLGHRGVKVPRLAVGGLPVALPGVGDHRAQPLGDCALEVGDGVGDAVGLAGQVKHQVLQQLEARRGLALGHRQGPGALQHGGVHPGRKHLLVEHLPGLGVDPVGVGRPVRQGPQLRPQGQGHELRVEDHPLEPRGGGAGEQRPPRHRVALPRLIPVLEVPDPRRAVLQHVAVGPGLVQPGDTVRAQQVLLLVKRREEPGTLGADLRDGREVGVAEQSDPRGCLNTIQIGDQR